MCEDSRILSEVPECRRVYISATRDAEREHEGHFVTNNSRCASTLCLPCRQFPIFSCHVPYVPTLRFGETCFRGAAAPEPTQVGPLRRAAPHLPHSRPTPSLSQLPLWSLHLLPPPNCTRWSSARLFSLSLRRSTPPSLTPKKRRRDTLIVSYLLSRGINLLRRESPSRVLRCRLRYLNVFHSAWYLIDVGGWQWDSVMHAVLVLHVHNLYHRARLGRKRWRSVVYLSRYTVYIKDCLDFEEASPQNTEMATWPLVLHGWLPNTRSTIGLIA